MKNGAKMAVAKSECMNERRKVHIYGSAQNNRERENKPKPSSKKNESELAIYVGIKPAEMQNGADDRHRRCLNEQIHSVWWNGRNVNEWMAWLRARTMALANQTLMLENNQK